MPPDKDIADIAAERALREARERIEQVHKTATEALAKLSDASVVGLSADVLEKFVQRFSEVKLMVAMSSPEVVAEFESRIASSGRELTQEEKTKIIVRISPGSSRVTLG